MGDKVTKEQILQAILKLSDEQMGLVKRLDKLEQGQKDLAEGQEDLAKGQKEMSQHLSDMENRLNEKIDIVSKKVDLVSNRLLDTEAEVSMLKGEGYNSLR